MTKILLLNACLAIVSFAQTQPAATTDSPFTNLPAHPIGPNDLLSVSVYGAPELSKLVRVSEDGFIRLPMLSSRIEVAGAMPAQVESTIAEALEGEEILVGPVVTVNVAEYNSRPINVAGAVRQPQTLQAVGHMRLLDAISKSGGLSDSAGADILVSQTGQPTRRIPVKGLLETADASVNIPLTGGEDIRVVEAGKAFVVGNVTRPGSFPLHDGEQSTVLQMLALSGGLAPYASKQAYIYRRDSDNGDRREIAVELDKILSRKDPNVAVLADDIFYVPEARGRKLGMAALERIVLFGTNSAGTALIYGIR